MKEIEDFQKLAWYLKEQVIKSVKLIDSTEFRIEFNSGAILEINGTSIWTRCNEHEHDDLFLEYRSPNGELLSDVSGTDEYYRLKRKAEQDSLKEKS